MPIPQEIHAYNAAQSPGDKRICETLAKAIDQHLARAENKIWHRHPVWFLDGNPIVGYSVLKGGVRLLFWSGQSFDEPGLTAEGKFKAAELRITDSKDLKARDLKRWLKKAKAIQWDYKNIVKRRGVLEKIGDDTLVKYSTQNLVMAYNDIPGVGSPVQADFAPTTPMQIDIAAIQYLYGPNLAYNAGNTVYTYTSTARYNETLWDGGGSDTIRVDGSANALISLVPGTWSQLGQPITYSERTATLTIDKAELLAGRFHLLQGSANFSICKAWHWGSPSASNWGRSTGSWGRRLGSKRASIPLKPTPICHNGRLYDKPKSSCVSR